MLSYAFAETSELQQFSHHPLAQVSYRIEARAARGWDQKGAAKRCRRLDTGITLSY